MINAAQSLEFTPPAPQPPSADAILERVFLDYERGRINVPSMPEAALKIRELALDPDVSVEELVTATELDPAIAGRLVAAANSVLTRGVCEVSSVREALIRLGWRQSCALATAIAVRSLFHSDDAELRKLAQELWHETVHTAAFMRVLAEKTPSEADPEKAFVIGLLHNIGGLALLGYVGGKGPRCSADGARVVLNTAARMVSLLVLERWDLDREFQAAAQTAGDWDRAGTPTVYGDLLNLARQQTELAAGRTDRLPAVEEIPAYWRIRPGPVDDDGRLLALVDNPRITALREMLG